MRLLCFAALLAISSVALAQQAPAQLDDKTLPATPSETSTTKQPVEKVTKIVCHREKPVGTQMVKRRCFTQGQLDIERERPLRIEP